MSAQVVKKARFYDQPMDQAGMEYLGTSYLSSLDARLNKAFNVRDVAAPALSPKYAARKRRLGKKPIRNWNLTGHLRSCFRIISATKNKVVIGVTDAFGLGKLRANQRRGPEYRQFGVSPRDLSAIIKALRQVRSIGKAKQVS